MSNVVPINKNKKPTAVDIAFSFLLLSDEEEMDDQKLHCLVYLAAYEHMGRTGELLFDDPILKGPHGPWIPALEEMTKSLESTFKGYEF